MQHKCLVQLDSLESRRLFAATKIMPLGDSITQGYGGQESYRLDLYNLLAQAGYSVDMVGSVTGTNDGIPAQNNLDENNEGHSGWTADQLTPNIQGWANTYKPDVVLLQIGTNDVIHGQDNPSTISDITDIINNLRAAVPNVKIILAQITPENYANGSQVPDLNSRIATLAASLTTGNSPIALVNQYSGFDVTADTIDGIHPNATGEAMEAQKYFTALQSILPTPTAPPPGLYLSDVTPTSASNGSGNYEQDRSNGGTGAIDGGTLTLNGTTYMRGLGVSAASALVFNIAGKGYTQFNSDIGVDDEIASGGGIDFQVYADNVLKYDSGTMTAASATKSISVDITGASNLKLVVVDAGGGSAAVDHGDWANARVYAATVAAPAAPTNLASSVSGSNISLNWADNSNNETNFRIERKVAGGAYATLTDVPANQTAYIDTTALAGTTYSYRVFAYNTGGNSGYSNESSSTVPAATASAYLSDLPYVVVANGWGPAEKDKSNGEAGAGDGTTIKLNGVSFAKGIGVHANSDITLSLGGKYSLFTAVVGLDDEVGNNGSVDFQIYVDGVKQFDSGTMYGSTANKNLSVSLAGAQKLELIVNNADGNYDFDHGDWANAYLTAAATTAPAAPSSLTANYVAASNGVVLSWTDNSNNETSFEIQRKTGSAGTWADYAFVAANGTSYIDTSVTASTTYYYRVYATNAAGNSTTSNEPSVTTPAAPTAPAAPSGATATYAASTGVTVTWNDNSPDETNFEIQRKAGSAGTWSNLASVAANVTTYVDASSLIASTTYYYRVYAYNSVGNSTTSNEPSITTPAAPTAPAAASNLAATYNSAVNQVSLSWTDNSSDETGFRIERKTGSAGTYAAIGTVGSNVATYIDSTALSASTTYYYRVIAYNSVGDGGPSNEQSITTAAAQGGSTVYLSDLPYVVVSNGWGPVEKDNSNGEAGSGDGHTLTLNGKTYAKGLGVHALSDITLNLAGKYSSFTSDIGIDDEVGNAGSVVFQVYLDGTKVFDSGTMTGASATQTVSVNTTGKQTLELKVNYVGGGNAYDHSDWAGAQLALTPTVPVPAAASNLAGSFDSAANQISLTWTDNSTTETGFRIERKAGSGSYATVGTVAANVSSFLDTTVLEPSKTYSYRVIAFNGTGDGVASNEFAYTTPAPTAIPTAASGLSASYNATTKAVTLSWTDNSRNESGFRVERQTAGGAWSTLTSVGEDTTTAVDAGPFTVSTSYNYRVVAYNSIGDAATPSNVAGITTPSATVYVSDLTPVSSQNFWGPVEKDMSNGEAGAGDGHTISIRGKTYAKGLGVHAYSKIVYNLNGAYSLFTTDLGIDDETGGNGGVIFDIYVDGVQKYTSGMVIGKDAIKTASVSVAGAQQIWLVVENGTDGADFDHADWANAQLTA